MPPRKPKSTADIRHTANTRSNLPSAEDATTMSDDDRRAEPYYYQRNRDLDPQLVWRGKDIENDMPLEVMAPPIYVQERIRPKHLIDDLRRHSDANPAEDDESQAQMFADFNGLPSPEARTEYYKHQANWSNRMILGDSLQVMASLAEKEGLKGQVQCIYMDPPYGINFRSNWQWSANNKTVGSAPKDITREPEQIRAFRDTWSDGINSYLSYLRDRLIMARDLLTQSGSLFVQMGDENVHRVRALMDEIFGDENFVTQITYRVTTGTQRSLGPPRIQNYILWYARDYSQCRSNSLFHQRHLGTEDASDFRDVDFNGQSRKLVPNEIRDPALLPIDSRVFSTLPLHSSGNGNDSPRMFNGEIFYPPDDSQWRHNDAAFRLLIRSGRVTKVGRRIRYKQYFDESENISINNVWIDTGPEQNKNYVVQTSVIPIQRCILMTSDPGDLVLDPTCGAGTTAYVAEQWGRRWITIDTSRVALALARGRLVGASFPYYVLEDSPEGAKERARLNSSAPPPEHMYHK